MEGNRRDPETEARQHEHHGDQAKLRVRENQRCKNQDRVASALRLLTPATPYRNASP